jgi:hypothetical protein
MDAAISTQETKNETITRERGEQSPPQDTNHQIRQSRIPIAVDIQPMVTAQQRR